ncbi:MAG: AEC family transporter [Anaerovoracaceae bacterium]
MYGQFFVLFALIFTGYFLKKFNLINDAMNSGMNKIILYIAYPAMLVGSIGQLDINEKMLGQFVLTFFISCGVFGIYAIMAYAYTKFRKYPKAVSNVAEASMTMPNNGFMGFPVAIIFFGNYGMLYMAANNAAMNLFLFTYVIYILRRNKKRKSLSGKEIVIKLGKVVFHPNMIGLALGLIVAYNNISLENPVGEYLGYMGNIAAPLAMIFIGSTLAGSHLLKLFKNKYVLESGIIKIIVFPALSILMVYFLPVDNLIKSIIVLSALLPTAAMVTMLSASENQDKLLAGKILVFTTALSMGTLIIGVEIVKNIFG